MALVKCKECGAEIAKSAKACPKCGAKQKQTSLAVKLILILIVLIAAAQLLTPSTNDTPKTVTKPALEELSTKLDERMKASDWFVARNYAQQIVDHYPISDAGKRAVALLPELEAKSKAERERQEAERKATKAKALASLRKQRDDVNGINFYNAPESPQSVANYWKLYLAVPDKGAPYLRFVFMYTGDDWLFIRGVTLNVDGEKLPDVPLNAFRINRDNSGGRVWEWYDEAISDKDLRLFERLVSSKKTIIRYSGSQYYKDRILSQEEKRAMRKVLDAYRAVSVAPTSELARE